MQADIQVIQESDDRRHTQFNGAWLGMVVLLVAVGLAARQRGLVALGACVLVVIPVAWLWKTLALRGVEYERLLDRKRAFPGEIFSMTVRLTNRKLLPLSWLVVNDEIPLALPRSDGALTPTYMPTIGTLDQVISLRWFQRVQRRYELSATARGVYALGPVHLTSGDSFNLFESRGVLHRRDRLVVFPPIWPLEELGLPAHEPFGEQKPSRRLLTDPLRTIGVRDHRPEDDLRHIHWKATAHRSALQVRVFEPAAAQSVVIALNVTTLPHHWQGSLPELFERTVSVAASLATWAAGHRHPVGLVANGCRSLSDQPVRVPPGRSPDQLGTILEALAAVTGFATTSIETLLRRESPRLPWGADLVVVTAIVTEELTAAILELRQAGRRMGLVSLAEDAPADLPGVTIHHVPSDAPAFQRARRGEWNPVLALREAGFGVGLEEGSSGRGANARTG